MRLYGSATNRILEACLQPAAKIGDGATVTAYSDRYACTIVLVEADHITVQEDNATRIDTNGMSDSQSYTYSPDKNGRYWYFRRNKRGQWQEVTKNQKTNRWNLVNGGNGLLIGTRRKYHDFSF